MSCRTRVWVASSLLASLLGVSAIAEAETLQLIWQAPKECPGETRFVAEVRARTANAQFTNLQGQGRILSVELTAVDRHYTGRLRLAQEQGSVSERSFEGERCDEVVSALALLTALAIDPNASSAPVVDLPALPPPEPNVQAKPEPEVKAEPKPGPTPMPRAPRKQPDVRVPKSEPPAPWRVALGVRGMIAGWVAPAVLPSGDLYGEVWQERTGMLTPGFRLGLGMAAKEGQDARWLWYLARLDACPVRVGLGWKLVSQSCLGVELGAVQGEGTSIAVPNSETRPWFALGAATGLLLDWKPLVAGVHTGIIVPVTRYHFFFDNPRTDVHQVPSVGAGLAISVGLRF